MQDPIQAQAPVTVENWSRTMSCPTAPSAEIVTRPPVGKNCVPASASRVLSASWRERPSIPVNARLPENTGCVKSRRVRPRLIAARKYCSRRDLNARLCRVIKLELQAGPLFIQKLIM